jgi:hypothetical protein
LIKEVPLVVPPSGNIKRGKYFPVVSIKSYLSFICKRIYALFSSVPPLGIYIESISSLYSIQDTKLRITIADKARKKAANDPQY